MPAVLLSGAALALIQKLMLFATLSLLFLLLPTLMSFIPGFEMNGGQLSWNVLSPLTNIMAMAPESFRWLIWYFHIDTALVMYLTALLYGFLKDVVFAAA